MFEEQFEEEFEEQFEEEFEEQLEEEFEEGRFNIFNKPLSGSTTVEKQISFFEKKLETQPGPLEVHFFGEYTGYYYGERHILGEAIISSREKDKYKLFLQKHASQITDLTIHISIFPEDLDRSFLDDCLSKLTHVKVLRLVCEGSELEALDRINNLDSVQMLPYPQKIKELTLGLNNLGKENLANLENIETQNLEYAENIKNFITFINSCTNVTKLDIEMLYADEYFIDKMINEIAKHSNLVDVNLNLCNAHLSNLSNIFSNIKIEKLKIELLGAHFYNKAHNGRTYLKAKDELEHFSNACLNNHCLKEFTLDLQQFCFENHASQGKENKYAKWSLNDLMLISNNRTLSHFRLYLPSEIVEKSQAYWRKFILNFKNSKLTSLKLDNVPTYAPLIKKVVEENKSLTTALGKHFQPLHTSSTHWTFFHPGTLEAYTGSFLHYVHKRKDMYLFERRQFIDMLKPHQESQKLSEFKSFPLYSYFCEVLFRKINRKELLSSSEKITSYLATQDLYNLLCVSGGFIWTVRQDIHAYQQSILAQQAISNSDQHHEINDTEAEEPLNKKPKMG